MGLIQDIVQEVRQVHLSGKRLKEEDSLRILAPNESRGHRLPIVYGDNDFFLSKNGAWTGYAIPNRPWGFLVGESRRQYFYAADAVFGRIFPAGKDNSGHLKVTNRVHSAEEWQQSLVERYQETASPKFPKYVAASRDVIEQKEFFERECYLFTRVGTRGSQGGLLGWVNALAETVLIGAGLDDSQPDDKEKDFWRSQAISTGDTLTNSWLAAAPIHRRRLEWLVRHIDTPGLPTPDTTSVSAAAEGWGAVDALEWGAGEWRTTLGSYTEVVDIGVVNKNRIRAVKFDAPTGTGTTYAAFLPVSGVPNGLHYGANWMHHASSLNFPVDADLRFEIIEADRAEGVVEKKIVDAESQEAEDEEAGVRADETATLQQQGLRDVKRNVRMSKQSIAFWQCVFSVYDTDPEELLSKVNRLIKHYKDIQFELVTPPMDQRELFYQSFPGSNVIIDSWIHRSDSKYLAAAQPWLTTSVGDRDDAHGLYQGYTIVLDANGTPQRGVPVFYDLQNVVDDEGKAPTEVTCGFPGSGKSVSRGLKIAHEDAMRGITQFVWDPKGDFLPLKAYAKQMQLNPDKVKLVDLYDSATSVSLDPFGIAEVDPDREIDDRESSAIDTLNSLCFEQTEDPTDGLRYKQVLSSAVGAVLRREAAGGARASMAGVIDTINEFSDNNFEAMSRKPSKERAAHLVDLSQVLFDHLASVRSSTLGRLLFRDPEEAGSMKVEQGDLIIFVAIRMNPTEPGAARTRNSAISDVISGLMTDFIRSLLYILPDYIIKSAIFDEWHVIKKTTRASALLDWLRRMGRSKRCLVRQMSQSALDFSSGSLSTVWCGYVESTDEAEASCDLLGIERSAANIATLMNLKSGEFLFRDVHKRVARVKVDIWDSYLLDHFRTDPAAKEALAKKLSIVGHTQEQTGANTETPVD